MMFSMGICSPVFVNKHKDLSFLSSACLSLMTFSLQQPGSALYRSLDDMIDTLSPILSSLKSDESLPLANNTLPADLRAQSSYEDGVPEKDLMRQFISASVDPLICICTTLLSRASQLSTENVFDSIGICGTYLTDPSLKAGSEKSISVVSYSGLNDLLPPEFIVGNKNEFNCAERMKLRSEKSGFFIP